MTTLKELIDSEPLNAARTDQEVLDWCNELQTIWIDVPWLEYAIWLSGIDGVGRLEDNKDHATLAVRSACQMGLAVLNGGQPLSLTRSEVRTGMNKLVTDVFTAAERDTLLAVGQKQVNRLVEAGVNTKNFGIGRIGVVRA